MREAKNWLLLSYHIHDYNENHKLMNMSRLQEKQYQEEK